MTFVINGQHVHEITVEQAFGPDNECIEPQQAELVEVQVSNWNDLENYIWLHFEGEQSFSMTFQEFTNFVETGVIDY